MAFDSLDKVLKKFKLSLCDIKNAQLIYGFVHISFKKNLNPDGFTYDTGIFEILTARKESVFLIEIEEDDVQTVQGYLNILLQKNNIKNISCYNEFEKAIEKIKNKDSFINSLKESN